MANLSITIANEILKIDYQDIVRDVLNSSVVLNYRLERDYESVQGDQVYIGLNTARNQSFASRSSGDKLPSRGTQTYNATFFTIPEMYGRLQVSQREIKASRNAKGALLRVLDAEMRHLIRDTKNRLNQMNYSDGLGILARINDATPGGTTVDLLVEKNGQGVVATNPDKVTRETYFASRYLENGVNINFVISANRAVGPQVLADPNTITVTATTKGASPTVTFSAAPAGLADGDWLTVHNSYANDQMGLLGLVDDGSVATRRFITTLQGIDRSVAANDFWNASILNNSGTDRDISLDLIQEAMDEAEIQGDGEVTLWLTTYGLRRNILALMVADKRFVAPYEMDLDGGFRALSYNGVPIVPDRHAPKHTMFGLDEPTLKFYQMSDIEWLEEDGSVLNRVVDEPLYEATLFLYRELACTDPKNNVRIDDLNDATNL